ncbi:MAG: glycogen debranching enzyme GlgX, partial [Nostocoides sp.]
KHNEENGEDNRDGTDNNRSFNHGAEGETQNADILTARRRSIRNLLGTLLLSTGVPMITGGDEFGRTQAGNNNAYCQDSPVSWFDWDLAAWQEDLVQTTVLLTRLRRQFPALRRNRFLTGMAPQPGRRPDVAWFGPDGQPITDGWADPGSRTLQVFLDGDGLIPVHLVLHGDAAGRSLTLPPVPEIAAFELVWDSTWERPLDAQTYQPLSALELGPACLMVFAGTLHA